MKWSIFSLLSILMVLSSCNKNNNTEPTGPKLIFKFRFDSTQTRLNNFGQEILSLPAGNAAQSPIFNSMSAHYIELAFDSLTLLGKGEILYKADEKTTNGESAINFSKAYFAGNNEVFYSVPVSNIGVGTYKWLRISLAYQNYDIKIKYVHPTYGSFNLDGTVASFIGFNTYIDAYTIKNQSVTVNGNRKQGYGGLEVSGLPVTVNPITWQAPAGATTVPNPIFSTSPVPQGSCVVTGRFANTLTITGNETEDIVVIVSLSTNKSFEWKDKNGDGQFQPVNALNNNLIEDSVVDMGIRGLIPIIE
jgi:hypothetical protein